MEHYAQNAMSGVRKKNPTVITMYMFGFRFGRGYSLIVIYLFLTISTVKHIITIKEKYYYNNYYHRYKHYNI